MINEKCLEKKVISISWKNIILLVAFLGTASCAVLALIFNKCNASGNFVFTSFLSGITGAFLSALFVLIGFNQNNETKKIDNQLRLRELFAEKERREVHRTLERGDYSYWYAQSGENEDSTAWDSSRAYKNYFLPALDDYMGCLKSHI